MQGNRYDVQAAATTSLKEQLEGEAWYYKPLVIVVFGASGDLAKRKTYPALFQLFQAHLLPIRTHIVGFARTSQSNRQFRNRLKSFLSNDSARSELTLEAESCSTSFGTKCEAFLQHCTYSKGSGYSDWQSLKKSLNSFDRYPEINVLAYLATPPNVFAEAAQALRRCLTNSCQQRGFVRIVLEKPFGRDTATCQELLSSLHNQKWTEEHMFRVDHYLGKEVVQAISFTRKHNSWLNAIWNRKYIQAVHILFKEPFGTNGRGGYFDSYGIIRDVIQNHLLQVFCLIAMELPEESSSGWHQDASSSDSRRDAKLQMLRSIPPIQPTDCLVGQYRGYADDTTIVNKDTNTPTYACVRTWVNNDRWRGVPFILEAGKALDEHLCEARVTFRGSSNDNALVFRLQPNPAVAFQIQMKSPGFSKHTKSETLSTRKGLYEGGTLPSPYSKLVLDVLRGRQHSFVRDDELLESWKIFTPLLQTQEADNVVRPCMYEYGSAGPDERYSFLQAMRKGHLDHGLLSSL